jgi:hypothetical protein
MAQAVSDRHALAASFIQGFLHSSQGKLAVFIDSRADLALLDALFPHAAVLAPIDPMPMRELALRRFQFDTGCRLLLADLRLAATGVDLSFATAAFFDLAYEHDPALLRQARARLPRPAGHERLPA